MYFLSSKVEILFHFVFSVLVSCVVNKRVLKSNLIEVVIIFKFSLVFMDTSTKTGLLKNIPVLGLYRGIIFHTM